MSTVASTTNTSSAANTLATSTTSASDQSDRFLKLLVAQMQNQDPLNPMDNAQLTSQMAQISTVSDLEKLNTTTAGLGTQFAQLQATQAAALVGHDVAIDGNAVRIKGSTGDGGFELSGAADKAAVQILDASGNVVDTVNLTNLAAGRNSFSWAVPAADQGKSFTFKVTATAGNTAVTATPLQYATISAASTFNNQLALELTDGSRVSYDAVWAFL
jgi:flagellar basal-body rod modification protein FlgD